jgi:4-amino-4-deoxy-L-arabinose transferase-like glycosyltransferase
MAALVLIAELRKFVTGRPRTALALLCVALWLPGIFALPPLDRDESRFAQSSKQMLESGDFIDIRFGQVPRYKKPVGIYWLQATTTAVAGGGERATIWTYRIASLMGGIAAVWIAFACARVFLTPEASFLGAALLGSSLLMTAEATIATTDAVLLASFLGAQTSLLRVYLSRKQEAAAPSARLIYAGWAALGISVLVKGPVGPAVCLVTVSALCLWDREWVWLRQLRPASGLAIALLINLPWAIAIAVASHGQFFEQALGNDFAAKLAGGQESHGALPGYYLAIATLTLWPVTLLVLPAIGLAVTRHREPVVRFLLAWIIAAWAMFELVPTKLPHYVLPVYPALALLAAWTLEQDEHEGTGWTKALRVAAPVQFAIGAVALAVAAVILPPLYGSGLSDLSIAGAAAGVFAALAACIVSLQGQGMAASWLAIGSALIFYPTLMLSVAPALDRLWVSPRAAELVSELRQPGDPPPILAGYQEPSLVFLLGTDTRLSNGEAAAGIQAQQGGLALIEKREHDRYISRIGALTVDARKVGELDGLDYSRGKDVHIDIYRARPMQLETQPPAE